MIVLYPRNAAEEAGREGGSSSSNLRGWGAAYFKEKSSVKEQREQKGTREEGEEGNGNS
jgi:hypothetical protein